MMAILLVQVGLRFIEYRFFAHHHPSTLTLRIAKGGGRVAEVERLVIAAKIPLRGLRLRAGRTRGSYRVGSGDCPRVGGTEARNVSRWGRGGTVVYRGFGHRPFASDDREAADDVFDTGGDSERSIA